MIGGYIGVLSNVDRFKFEAGFYIKNTNFGSKRVQNSDSTPLGLTLNEKIHKVKMPFCP